MKVKALSIILYFQAEFIIGRRKGDGDGGGLSMAKTIAQGLPDDIEQMVPLLGRQTGQKLIIQMKVELRRQSPIHRLHEGSKSQGKCRDGQQGGMLLDDRMTNLTDDAI